MKLLISGVLLITASLSTQSTTPGVQRSKAGGSFYGRAQCRRLFPRFSADSSIVSTAFCRRRARDSGFR
jgi:hypothetical protein